MRSSRQGFALVWMVTLISALGIFSSFALGYFYIEARRSNRIIAHDLLRRTFHFKNEECLNILNAHMGSDRCAMTLLSEKENQSLVFSTNNQDWQPVAEKLNATPLIFRLGKKQYTVESMLHCLPDYHRQHTVQSDPKRGGLKADLNTLLSELHYNQFKGKQLWEGGLTWDIFYDYKLYLNQLKQHPKIANINPLSSENAGDGWKNMFAAWRGFTAEKHAGLEYIKKVLISPVVRQASLDFQFSMIPIQQPSGMAYRLHSLILIPAILIHNPYDVNLHVDALDCVWNLDVYFSIYTPNESIETDASTISIKNVLAHNNDTQHNALVLELPEMTLAPGEKRWLHASGNSTNRSNAITMQKSNAQGSGLNLILDNPTIFFPENAQLSIGVEDSKSWSQLKLINPKTSEYFWRAENIAMRNAVTSLMKFTVQPQSFLRYTITFSGMKNTTSNPSLNDCAISIHSGNWQGDWNSRNPIADYAPDIRLHLPQEGFNSLGDCVYLPFIPLDILSKHQLGAASQTHSETNATSQLPPIQNLSRHLNAALWNGYWVCSEKLKNTGNLIPIPQSNSTHPSTVYTPAERYWIKNSFNVNCTNPQEWVTFLSKHLPWDTSIIHALANNISILNQQQGPYRCIADWISGSGGADNSIAVLQSAINRMQIRNTFNAPLNQAEVIARIAHYLSIRWDTLQLHMDTLCPEFNTSHAQEQYRHTKTLFQRFPNQWQSLDSSIKKDSEQIIVPSREWKVMSFTTQQAPVRSYKAFQQVPVGECSRK